MTVLPSHSRCAAADPISVSAALRLARLIEAEPGAVSARMSEQTARAARPALTVAEVARAYANRTRIPRCARPTDEDPTA